jgi:hypothetical protein
LGANPGFIVDDNMDPEIAEAIRMSLKEEEERKDREKLK